MNRRFLGRAVMAAFVVLGCCLPALAQNRGHLYIVIATDDNDENVGAHVLQDGRNIKGAVGGNVARDEFTVTKVDPDSLSPRTILAAIRQQPAGPNDALFIYFSGHGAFHPTIGQYFWLTGPKRALPRSRVRDAIKEKNPRLGIIISDCCYNLFDEPPSAVLPAAIVGTKPLFDELFFKTNGFVDVTSSKEGQFSMCYPQAHKGSIFTQALQWILWEEREVRLSWKELFKMTQEKTAQDFTEVHPRGVKARGGTVVQRTQTAWAFTLPD
jgi:hypothetical protein